MPEIPNWRRYLRFWRPDIDADIDDELRFHIDARTEALRARGHSSESARRLALEEFGDVEATRRGLREIGQRVERRRERLQWWQYLRTDLRYVLRSLRATPLFTAGVVLTLAVGIGATASMYGTMRRLLLQPPPHVAAPEQLTRLYFNYARAGDSARTFDMSSYPFYERLRERARTLAAVAAYDPGEEVVVGAGPDARLVSATLVSAGFWQALGTRPLLGRFIADDEAHPATGARVVVLGHAFWRRVFGGDSAVVGTTVRVKGQPYRVLGVAPRGFRGVELTDTDIWLPLFALADGTDRPATWHTFAGSSNLKFVVRRRLAAAPAQMAAELSREHALFVAEEQAQAPPDARQHVETHVALGGLTGALGSNGRRIPEGTVTVWLVGVAGVLLVIACANVASLLLLRALHRRREIGVRLALGMSRGRLATLLFAESAVLAIAGAAAAAILVVSAGAWIRRALLPGMVDESAGVDWRTIALSGAVVVLTALLTGLAPVRQTVRADVMAGLRDGAQHGATRRSRAYWSLLVAQTALSAMLLVGAGLFLRSLHHVTTTDLGLDTEHAWVVSLRSSGSGRSPRELAVFFEQALERVRAVPGVRSASLATHAPLRGATGLLLRTRRDGEWVQATHGSPLGSQVADGYFDALGLRLAAGRGFTAADRTSSTVVVVNEALARLAWPGRSPVGACAFLSSSPETCARVVGVARNAHTFRIREEQQLAVYVPLPPAEPGDRVLLVRETPGIRGLDGTLRHVLRELDPALPYLDVQRLGDALVPEIRPWRLGATVFTVFGVLAALLAALGLYTAMAYAVTQRTREIGVRVALGAQAHGILRLVLGDALRLAGAGILTGLVVAIGVAGGIADLLFETSPRDPAVFATVGFTLLGVALAACVAPARRAARVSPTEALRAD